MTSELSPISTAVLAQRVQRFYSETWSSFPPEFLADPDAQNGHSRVSSSCVESFTEEPCECDGDHAARIDEAISFEPNHTLSAYWTQKDVHTPAGSFRVTVEVVRADDGICRVHVAPYEMDQCGEPIFMSLGGYKTVTAAEAADPLLVAYVYSDGNAEVNIAPNCGGQVFFSTPNDSLVLMYLTEYARHVGISTLLSLRH